MKNWQGMYMVNNSNAQGVFTLSAFIITPCETLTLEKVINAGVPTIEAFIDEIPYSLSPAICAEGTHQVKVIAEGADFYEWSHNSTETDLMFEVSPDQNSVWFRYASENFTINVKTRNSCGESNLYPIHIVIDPNCNSPMFVPEETYQIYPNPTDDYLNIVFDEVLAKKSIQISLYNAQQKRVLY